MTQHQLGRTYHFMQWHAEIQPILLQTLLRLALKLQQHPCRSGQFAAPPFTCYFEYNRVAGALSGNCVRFCFVMSQQNQLIPVTIWLTFAAQHPQTKPFTIQFIAADYPENAPAALDHNTFTTSQMRNALRQLAKVDDNQIDS